MTILNLNYIVINIKYSETMSKIRGHNHTEREKQELLNIIEKYKEVVENRKTDNITTNKKKEIWNKITSEYNSIADRPREVEHLKGCYVNMKRSSRQQYADERAEEYWKNRGKENMELEKVQNAEQIMRNEAEENRRFDRVESIRTGGGTYISKTTDVDNKILSICEEQFNPLPNAYDDASNYFENVEGNYLVAEDSSLTIEKNYLDTNETSNAVNSKRSIENTVQHDVNSTKNSKKSSNFKDKLTKYAHQRIKKIGVETDFIKLYNERKLELINLQIEQLKKEHELNLKCKEEEHKNKMILLNLEIKLEEAELEKKL